MSKTRRNKQLSNPVKNNEVLPEELQNLNMRTQVRSAFSRFRCLQSLKLAGIKHVIAQFDALINEGSVAASFFSRKVTPLYNSCCLFRRTSALPWKWNASIESLRISRGGHWALHLAVILCSPFCMHFKTGIKQDGFLSGL